MENQNKKNDSTSCDSCFDIYLLYSYWRYFCIYEWCSYACKDNCSGSSCIAVRRCDNGAYSAYKRNKERRR